MPPAGRRATPCGGSLIRGENRFVSGPGVPRLSFVNMASFPAAILSQETLDGDREPATHSAASLSMSSYQSESPVFLQASPWLADMLT